MFIVSLERTTYCRNESVRQQNTTTTTKRTVTKKQQQKIAKPEKRRFCWNTTFIHSPVAVRWKVLVVPRGCEPINLCVFFSKLRKFVLVCAVVTVVRKPIYINIK